MDVALGMAIGCAGVVVGWAARVAHEVYVMGWRRRRRAVRGMGTGRG